MNMISTGAFQNEMGSSNKQTTLAEKFAAVWEKKNAKAARAGGVSLMALSLAACGSSSDDTTTTSSTDTATDTATDTTTTTTTTPVASTYTLSAGMDNVTGAGGDDFAYGAITAAATTTTLEAYDRIDLGAGTDTMVLTLSGGNYVGDTSISGVENFTVQASGAGRSFDADALEGMATFTNNQSGQNMTVTNMESASTTIAIYKDSTANTTDVTFKNAALAGTSDTVTLSLDRVTATEAVVLQSSGTNGIENVSIVSNGSVKNFLGQLTVDDSGNADTMVKLTVTGSADLDMDANVQDFAGNATTSTATVDASAMTGALLISLQDADANLMHTVTTGSGDDSIAMGTSLNSLDTIDAGAGTDSVSATGLADGTTTALATAYNLTNVENLSFTGADEASFTINAANQAGLEKITFVENADGNDNNGDTYTATNLAAGVSVQLSNSVNSRDMNTVTLSLADASGSDDSLSVTVAGTSGHGTDNNVDDIAISDIETLALTSSFLGTTAMTATEFNVVDDISADTTLTKITVSGTEKTNITVGAEATNLATIDASGLADNFTVDVSNLTSNTTITGTAKNDTFTMGTTLTNGDTIDGASNGTAATDGDTLTATINGLTAESGALNIANVESMRMDTVTAASLINAAGITGTGTLAFASAQNVTVSNLASGIKIGLGYSDTDDDYTGTLDVSLADETGTADSITFNIVDQAANNAVNATLKAAATLESATINVGTDDDGTDAATLNVANLKAGTLTLTNGSSAGTNFAADTLTLGTLSTSTGTVDASAFAGIVSATAGTGKATAFSLKGGVVHDVTGSTGVDSVTISTTDSNTAYNVDGGAGTDTLTLNMGTATFTDTNVDNFEVINYIVGNSKDAVVTTAAGKGVNDNDTTTVNISGGNSISSMGIGGTAAIGAAGGTTATGLVTFNAADFKGNLSASFGDSVLDTALTVTGGTGSDKVYGTYDTAATEVIRTSGIEKLHILADRGGDSGETYTFNMANVTGASLISISAGAATADDSTLTLSNLAAGQTIAMGATAANGISAGTLFGSTSLTATLASATGTADALTLNLVDTDEDAGVGVDQTDFNSAGLESLTIAVANSDEDHDIDLAGVTATTGSKTAITVTGGKDAGTDATVDASDAGSMLEINDMSSSVNSFNSSAFNGNILMTGRHTNAMEITGGIGDDTFRMEHANDVINAGAGTDTLVISKAAILGGINIDLTATDQVGTFNGSANATAQTGFVNVDASGYTGNYGAQIQAGASGSKITGTNQGDEITLTTSQADIVVVNDTTTDTINGFTVSSDKLHLDISALGTVSDGGAALSTAGDTIVVKDITADTTVAAGDNIFFISGDYTTTAALDTALETGAREITLAANATTGEDIFLVYDDGTDSKVAIANIDSATGAAIDTVTITVLATLAGISDADTLTATEFVFV